MGNITQNREVYKEIYIFFIYLFVCETFLFPINIKGKFDHPQKHYIRTHTVCVLCLNMNWLSEEQCVTAASGRERLVRALRNSTNTKSTYYKNNIYSSLTVQSRNKAGIK